MSGVTEAFFGSPTLGEHTDDLAPGLILVVRPSKTGRLRKSWILRAVVDGRRRKVGLGACGLAEARRRAAEARQLIHEGKGPQPSRKSPPAGFPGRFQRHLEPDLRRGRGSMAPARVETAQSENC